VVGPQKRRKWPVPILAIALMAVAVGAVVWAGRPGTSARATQEPRAHFPVASVDWAVPSPTPTPTRTPSPTPSRTPTPTMTPTPTATLTPVGKVPVPESGAYIGAFVDLYEDVDSNFTSLEEQVMNWEEKTGKHLVVGLVYMDFRFGFLSARIQRLVDLGVVPLVTWDPKFVEGLKLQNIIDGEWDDYIRTWAQEAKNIRSPMFVRFGHEMNGDWYAHGGPLNGGGETGGYGDPNKADGPERYVDAWRHVHTIFEESGAGNISWVFSPNADTVPYESWNYLINYYPGDEYVDWVGVDGYNWGNTAPEWGSSWHTFEDVFNNPWYDHFLPTLLSQIPDKPFMIAEFASTEFGGPTGQVGVDKANWITDAYLRIRTQYPRIRAAIWFDLDKETCWHISSSEGSEQAFRDAVSHPYYLDRLAD